MVELENSGERVIECAYLKSPEAYVIYIMHMAAYRFAEEACRGKAVLDFGCGTGYGASHLANIAQSVHGVDVDEGAVSFASARYVRHNLTYSLVSPANLPFEDNMFDVVLSFQVIEHIKDESPYLKEASRVLKPGGVIIVVTPDRKHRLLFGQKPWNRWHVREYSKRRLERVVAKVFQLQQSLKMGAPWRIAGTELRRYRRTKWLTLPLTLPIVPEVFRRRGLDFLHSLRSPPSRVNAAVNHGPLSFSFDESEMIISTSPPNPLNLIVVAVKPRALER